MSAKLKQFVSDRLGDLLGFTNSTMVEFVVALAKSSKDESEYLSKLKEAGVTDVKKATSFAREMFSKTSSVRTKAKMSSIATEATRSSVQRSYAEEAARSRNYTLVLSSSEEDEESVKKKKKKKRRKKSKSANELSPTGENKNKDSKKDRKSRRRKRQRNIRERSSSGEDVIIKRRKQTVENSSEPEEKIVETEEQRDQREKIEFEERLRLRDEAKTKRFQKEMNEETNDPAKKKNSARENMSLSEQRKNMSRLRELSRRKYLTEREKKQLDLLEFQIKDEEYLFGDEKLTNEERRIHEANKKLLAIAKTRLKEFDEKDEGYHMPDEKNKKELLTQRYIENDGEKEKSGHEVWEENRAKSASFKFGSAGGNARGSEYKLVLDDQIDFVSAELDSEKKMIIPGSEEDQKIQEQIKKSRTLKLADVRKTLPIYGYREELLKTIDENQIVIVVGETGSGKTTQIPQYLHEAGYTKKSQGVGQPAIKVACTQPRRVAAMSVAARVAQEAGVKLGNEVGYSIRFEDCTSERTILKYMTDGMLLREFLASPDLETYSAIMIDEAHERTLHTDVLFGLVKDIARFRSDLRLIISSATMDAEKFSEYFDDAPIFVIPGRMYPIDTLYCKAPEADYIDAAVVTALQTHATQPVPGDILIFLTGQLEIETAEQMLRERTEALGGKIRELIICPIYSSLPAEKQALVFQPAPPEGRKVVLATNIAETSLTIDGVSFVIDTGFCKQKSYNPKSGMESLLVTPISKAAASQRAGRAGRTGPGTCFRLFTAWSYKNELADNTVPEIQRTNLCSVVLMLKSLGINDLVNFDFMDPPPASVLMIAFETLYALGAINSKGELTKMGRRMAEFPCNPQLSKMILASEKYGCVDEALTICAMLDVNNAVFTRPKERKVHADNARSVFNRGGHGDHIALLRVYNEWKESGYSNAWCFENFIQPRSMKRARDIREQMLGLCERVELEVVSNEGDIENIMKTVTAGYFYNAAKLEKSGLYRTIKQGLSVNVHPQSAMFKHEPMPHWVIYHDLVFTSKEYMRQIIPIKPEWLLETAPHVYKNRKEIVDDASSKKLPKGIGKASKVKVT
eukprot:g3949.t1